MRVFRFLYVGLLLPFGLSLGLVGCTDQEAPYLSGLGKRPIYISDDELTDIRNLPQQDIEQTGSIFLLDTLFFMAEAGKGIHVYSMADTANTVYLTFLKVPAIVDYSISDGFLYASCWRDLVTIDISNLYLITEVSRGKNVFEPYLFPPLYSGIFECIDESRGAVAGWEDAELEKVYCSTIN